MRENRLQFLVDERTRKHIWARARRVSVIEGLPRRRAERTLCFDTPDHALKQAGIFLTLRQDGRRWLQSVETDNRDCDAPVEPRLETMTSDGRPRLEAIANPSLRHEIMTRVNGSPLQQVYETIARRAANDVRLAGGSRVEMTVETTHISAGERQGEVRELVLTLIEGNLQEMFGLAESLLEAGDFAFSNTSKPVRGYLLAEQGSAEPHSAPRHAALVALKPHQTTELAARDVLQECFAQIADNVRVVCMHEDPEGPHQLRIGLRRLRSALSIFGPALRSAETARLKAEARWLGGEVGSLRDLDVLANDILAREARAYPEERGLAAIGEALKSRGCIERTRLRATLKGERVTRFLFDLARLVETRGWLVPADFEQTQRLARPAIDMAASALARRWKRTRRQARDLDTLDAGQRHELRKELKKLRYAAEFLSSLFPAKRVEAFLKRLRKLQNMFGNLNDAELVRTKIGKVAAPGSEIAGAERAAGWLIGASLARADAGWERAASLWRDVEGTQPFWK
jgi:triphosphatase